MNKTELLAESVRAGLVVHKTWSTEELRAILREHRESNKELDGKMAMRGLAGMTLPQLKAKADTVGVQYPNAITKGNLLRLIRDSVNTPANELMTFGRYRGYEFQEVPASYGEWAVAEANRSDNASADLIRFAKWYHKERAMKNMQTYGVEDFDDSAPARRTPASRAGYMSTPTDSRDSRPLTSWNTEGPITMAPGRNHKGKAGELLDGILGGSGEHTPEEWKGQPEDSDPEENQGQRRGRERPQPHGQRGGPGSARRRSRSCTHLALLKDKAKNPGP